MYSMAHGHTTLQSLSLAASVNQGQLVCVGTPHVLLGDPRPSIPHLGVVRNT